MPLMVESARGVLMLAQIAALTVLTALATLTPPVGIVLGSGALSVAWHLAPRENRASVALATVAGVIAAAVAVAAR